MQRVASLALAAGLASAERLTSADFDEKVYKSGVNTVFINFFASSCPFSKDFAPVWDNVTRAFADSSSVRIHEVDCDDAGSKSACSNARKDWPPLTPIPRGFPRITYYMPPASRLHTYESVRTAEEIIEHIEYTDRKRCDTRYLDACTAHERWMYNNQFKNVRLKEMVQAHNMSKRAVERGNFALLRAEKELKEIDPETRKIAYKRKQGEVEAARTPLRTKYKETRERYILFETNIWMLREHLGRQDEDPAYFRGFDMKNEL